MSEHMGWECPVCHKGNAPDVKACVHCKEKDDGVKLTPQSLPVYPVYPVYPYWPPYPTPLSWRDVYVGDQPDTSPNITFTPYTASGTADSITINVEQ